MLFSYFELAASLFTLLLAFYIYNRHYANRVARFYGRLALVGFFASIFEYSLRIAFTFDIAIFINRISISFWAFLFAMFVHFALIFAKKDDALKNRAATMALYFPAAVFSVFFIFGNFMYTRYEIQPIGIVNQPSPYYWFFALYCLAYSAWGIYLFLSFARTAPQKTAKEQALLIGAGCLLAFFVGAVTDVLMPLLMGYRAIFPTIVFDVAFLNLVIFIAMRKYALFAITPALAADTIIRTMPDPMIVTDLEGNILLSNEEADRLLHCREEDIEGCNVANLFKDKEKYKKLYNEVVNQGKEIVKYEAEIVDPNGEVMRSLINANKLHDTLGATLGIVFIIH